MVDIAPFHGIRYTAEKIDDLLAPPYDVIKPALQDELYARHPNNIVRIDLTRDEQGDDEGSKYTRAAECLSEWMQAGLLKKDDDAAIYVLAQTFVGPDGVERTRTGFFSRTRLYEWDEGQILPHERTLRGPKIDRLNLMRSTHANLSPIFLAYSDPDGSVGAIMAEATAGEPVADATMDDVRNRMWAVTDASLIAKITAAFESKKLYVADGHHRYETGIAYRNERRTEAVGHSAEPGFEHILTFSAATEDPGMVIFPTHRLAHSMDTFDEAQVLEKLGRFFDVKPAEPNADTLAEAGASGIAFLMVTKTGSHLLTAKADAPFDDVDELPTHASLKRLDVAVLHAVVFEHVLGVSREDQATQKNLKYSKSFAEAASAPTDDVSVQAAFLMNPTKIGEVIAVAESGEVMPQKSTFFYPKLPSGLLLHPLD